MTTNAILVGSLKGGVGKTTVATNVAKSLGATTVVDADIDSSNFASVVGVDGKGEVTEDREFVPASAGDIDVYSVETMFEDSTISLKEGAMADLTERLIHHALLDEPEYLVIDCPPGASSVFRRTINTLSEKGVPRALVAVSQPNALTDLDRQVTICNHLKLPIAGFVENMSGTSIDPDFAPFGSGGVENMVDDLGGNFYGRIPLTRPEERDERVRQLTDQIITDLTQRKPFMDERMHADPDLFDHLMNAMNIGTKVISNEIPIDQLQSQYGVDGLDLTMEVEITDIGKTFYVGVRDGAIRPIKNPENIAGGVKLPLRELRDGLAFEREAMFSPTGETITMDYSLTQSVKLGFAEIEQNLDNLDMALSLSAWDMLVTLEYLIREKIDTDRIKDIAQESGASQTI